MALLVVYSYSDGAATKTEGSASSISSFLLKTVSFKAFFIATYFTLSDETLDDLNEAMEEIAVTAPSKILDKIDGYILGTAGDDSSAIAGLFTSTKKTDFASATTYAASIPNANEFDVISTMKLQCETANYIPDVVVLNLVDLNKLAAKKDQIDNSINDRRVVFNNVGEPVAVCGLRIIKSTAITADSLAVLDSKQLMIGKKKDMTMEMGYNAADFTEGQKTVVLKVRLAFGVRDPLAVTYCSGLSAAVSAITIV
jgi:HK97 family phage major capsid protein